MKDKQGNMFFNVPCNIFAVTKVKADPSGRTGVCGRSPAENVDSNPVGDMDVCLCECCVLSGRGL
jgi:hypothetical protein